MSQNLQGTKCDNCRKIPKTLWRIYTFEDDILNHKFCIPCMINFIEGMDAKMIDRYLKEADLNVFRYLQFLKSYDENATLLDILQKEKSYVQNLQIDARKEETSQTPTTNI